MRHVPLLTVIIVTVVSFLSVTTSVKAQDTSLTSLYANNITTKDSQLVVKYLRLSNDYLNINPDSSVFWAEKVLSLALINNNWNFQQDGLQALRQAETSLAKTHNAQQDAFQYQLSKSNTKLIVLIVISLLLFLIVCIALLMYQQKKNAIKNFEVDETEHVEIIKNLQSDLKIFQEENTDLKKEQQELHVNYTKLVKSNEIKDKLIPMIAHDIRSPLATLQNTLSLTRDNIITPEEFQKLSMALESDVFNLRGMLDNMLLWAREQMFEVKINKVKFDLSETFREVILMYRSNLVSKNITLYNYMPQNLEVNSDKEIISVVVRNILSNAVKFTEPGKSIYISQIFFNNKTYISVRDEGKGISAETLKRLNNKQHITSRGTANEKGTGLGLLFSSEMLTKLDEAFDITSYPDKGTSATFSVSMN